MRKWFFPTFVGLSLVATNPIIAYQIASLESPTSLESGTQITIQTQTTEAVPEITLEILEITQRVLERRLLNLGINQASVAVQEPNQL
ncbi:MAG: hypothetical protein QNJ46_26505 [Leptolyngbyaceae cyanobacterium MO_188.B28]|nr:hypothetical protein [Leptolyngbyaceae cyanobacterium MO_188.B28]